MIRDRDIRREFAPQHGPGGHSCPCCNDWGCHPRKSKPLERRMIRRKMRQADQKLYQDIDETE